MPFFVHMIPSISSKLYSAFYRGFWHFLKCLFVRLAFMLSKKNKENGPNWVPGLFFYFFLVDQCIEIKLQIIKFLSCSVFEPESWVTRFLFEREAYLCLTLFYHLSSWTIWMTQFHKYLSNKKHANISWLDKIFDCTFMNIDSQFYVMALQLYWHTLYTSIYLETCGCFIKLCF